MTRRMRRGSLACALAAAVAAAAAPAAFGAPAAGLLQRGQAVYARCAACHAIDADRVGPQHCGLFGRRAGAVPGFDGYSPAMKASGIVWDERSLDRFLRDPLRAVPGTAMTYAGVPDAVDRAALIAWLRMATRPGQACAISP